MNTTNRYGAVVLALLVCVLAAPGRAGAPSDPAGAGVEPREIDAVEGAVLREVERLGRRIYDSDRAARRALSALADTVDIGGRAGIEGWLVLPKKDDWLVRFMGPSATGSPVLHDVRIDAEGASRVFSWDPTRKLEGDQAAMYRARQTALRAIRRTCSSRYASVVLGGEGREGFQVYLLGESDEPSRVLLGGHYVLSVSADGSSLQRIQQLSESCNTVPWDGPRAPGAGIEVEHFLTDTPLETHIFLSLAHEMPLHVRTHRGTFLVENGRIVHEASGVAPGTVPKASSPGAARAE